MIVVCWLYKSPTGHRNYGTQHVHRLMDMFRKNYTKPHRFLCITDQPDGLKCETLPMPLELDYNYRRLWLFSKEAAELIPGRIFHIDLDVVIVRNLDSYLDRKEPFVVMHDPMFKEEKYSSSYILDTGSRTDIWESFDPVTSPEIMQAWFKKIGRKCVGSDQAWICYCLRKGKAATFIQYRARLVGKKLPVDAHIVHFPANPKPWTEEARNLYPWIV
jgi:hypothetical protein